MVIIIMIITIMIMMMMMIIMIITITITIINFHHLENLKMHSTADKSIANFKGDNNLTSAQQTTADTSRDTRAYIQSDRQAGRPSHTHPVTLQRSLTTAVCIQFSTDVEPPRVTNSNYCCVC